MIKMLKKMKNKKPIESVFNCLANYDINGLQDRTDVILFQIVKSISSDVFFDTSYLKYRYFDLTSKEMNLQQMFMGLLDEWINMFASCNKVS